MKKIDEQTKNKLIQYYLSKPMSINDAANHVGISYISAQKILKPYPKYSKTLIFNPNLNEHYFHTIDSEDKAYFLGFIIGDGNVFTDYCKNGYSAMISITANECDLEVLESFITQTGASTTIGRDGRGARQAVIRSNIMADDLKQYGVISRKTEHTYLPTNIPEQFMKDVIRGICDSDGSVGAKPLKNNPNKFNHWISFCGTEQLMNDISNYCFQHLSLKHKSSVYTYKNKTLSETKFKNIHDMHTVGMWLYDNSDFYLSRKKDKFVHFCEHYNMEIPR
uniref:Endonuclease n=1 Tax=Siphoviridae sp. ctnPP24 TaxID=2825662 RepID=A0A8S5TZ16_9CAUD|nr:MAG TPA: endonuclease [Siphoviridae sp. ctnPP24]